MSNSWRNPELFAEARAYCVGVFDLWRRVYVSEELTPHRAVQKAHFEGTGVRFTQETHPDLISLTSDTRIYDPSQVPSRTTVENAMRADERVARHLDTLVGTSGGSMSVTSEMCLRAMLYELLKGENTFLFDEDRFRRIYAAMEDYFYSDVIGLRLMAPLSLFEMQADRINLESHLFLRQLSPSEREQLVLQGVQFPGFGLGGLHGMERVGLELMLDVPKIFGERPQPADPTAIPMAKASQEFQEVLSALRVFKTGQVSYSMIQQIPRGWNPGGAMSSYGLNLPVLGEPYELSAEEAPRFATFWGEYHRARRRNRPRIDLALRRLNFGYERIRPEDRLIDYVIGLEALLTKGNEGGDLKYRLTLRGARLLGNDATVRAKVHTDLDWAYRLRSHIVHGTDVGPSVSIEPEIVPFDELVERIAQHLRDAIRQFMMRTTNTSEAHVIKELDREAIAGS